MLPRLSVVSGGSRAEPHHGARVVRQLAAFVLQERGVPFEDRPGSSRGGYRGNRAYVEGHEHRAIGVLLGDVQASLFEVFNVRIGTVQTAVLAKHLAAALRTQRLERVVISQKPGDAVTMSVRLECPHAGLVKNYGLNCVTDAEHLKATVDPSLMPITLVVRPKEFGRLLSHFQSAQTDVTVSFAPESTGAAPPVGGFTGGFGDGRGETSTAPARNLRLSSFSDPNAPPGQTLQTSISLDTAEDAVLRYEHAGSPDDGAGDAARDVTVNLKDYGHGFVLRKRGSGRGCTRTARAHRCSCAPPRSSCAPTTSTVGNCSTAVATAPTTSTPPPSISTPSWFWPPCSPGGDGG